MPNTHIYPFSNTIFAYELTEPEKGEHEWVASCMRISEFDWIYVTQHTVNLQ